VRGIVHASAAVGVVAVTVLLSGCGQQDGVDLARQACGHVTISIKLYERAAHDADTGRAARERTDAIEQLEGALQLAAQANSANPEWNPLMTTLQESERISEQYLLPALRAQCALADSSNPQAPVITSTVPGQPPAPTPSTLPGR
jgi:hypothetical protein